MVRFDPSPSGSFDDFDFTGGENGDKCAWYFGKESGPSGGTFNQTINGRHYNLQLEWSNDGKDCLASYPGPTISKATPVHGVVGDDQVLQADQRSRWFDGDRHRHGLLGASAQINGVVQLVTLKSAAKLTFVVAGVERPPVRSRWRRRAGPS
jgi:hypothetical protein